MSSKNWASTCVVCWYHFKQKTNVLFLPIMPNKNMGWKRVKGEKLKFPFAVISLSISLSSDFLAGESHTHSPVCGLLMDQSNQHSSTCVADETLIQLDN